MLNHPTLDKLHALKFTGMAQALNEQMDQPEIEQLSFEQRLGLLVDREMTERADRRLTSVCAKPGSNSPPASRTSTTTMPAASTRA